MPFVAAGVDQLRVGDEVEANDANGSLARGVIHRIEPCSGRDVMVHFGGPEWTDRVGWYFDPSPHFSFTRTWTVLSRDLEPEVVTPRPAIDFLRARADAEVAPAGKAATGGRHEYLAPKRMVGRRAVEIATFCLVPGCGQPAAAAVHQPAEGEAQ